MATPRTLLSDSSRPHSFDGAANLIAAANPVDDGPLRQLLLNTDRCPFRGCCGFPGGFFSTSAMWKHVCRVHLAAPSKSAASANATTGESNNAGDQSPMAADDNSALPAASVLRGSRGLEVMLLLLRLVPPNLLRDVGRDPSAKPDNTECFPDESVLSATRNLLDDEDGCIKGLDGTAPRQDNDRPAVVLPAASIAVKGLFFSRALSSRSAIDVASMTADLCAEIRKRHRQQDTAGVRGGGGPFCSSGCSDDGGHLDWACMAATVGRNVASHHHQHHFGVGPTSAVEPAAVIRRLPGPSLKDELRTRIIGIGAVSPAERVERWERCLAAAYLCAEAAVRALVEVHRVGFVLRGVTAAALRRDSRGYGPWFLYWPKTLRREGDAPAPLAPAELCPQRYWSPKLRSHFYRIEKASSAGTSPASSSPSLLSKEPMFGTAAGAAGHTASTSSRSRSDSLSLQWGASDDYHSLAVAISEAVGPLVGLSHDEEATVGSTKLCGEVQDALTATFSKEVTSSATCVALAGRLVDIVMRLFKGSETAVECLFRADTSATVEVAGPSCSIVGTPPTISYSSEEPFAVTRQRALAAVAAQLGPRRAASPYTISVVPGDSGKGNATVVLRCGLSPNQHLPPLHDRICFQHLAPVAQGRGTQTTTAASSSKNNDEEGDDSVCAVVTGVDPVRVRIPVVDGASVGWVLGRLAVSDPALTQPAAAVVSLAPDRVPLTASALAERLAAARAAVNGRSEVDFLLDVNTDRRVASPSVSWSQIVVNPAVLVEQRQPLLSIDGTSLLPAALHFVRGTFDVLLAHFTVASPAVIAQAVHRCRSRVAPFPTLLVPWFTMSCRMDHHEHPGDENTAAAATDGALAASGSAKRSTRGGGYVSDRAGEVQATTVVYGPKVTPFAARSSLSEVLAAIDQATPSTCSTPLGRSVASFHSIGVAGGSSSDLTGLPSSPDSGGAALRWLAKLFLDAAAALDHLHAAGLAHGSVHSCCCVVEDGSALLVVHPESIDHLSEATEVRDCRQLAEQFTRLRLVTANEAFVHALGVYAAGCSALLDVQELISSAMQS